MTINAKPTFGGARQAGLAGARRPVLDHDLQGLSRRANCSSRPRRGALGAGRTPMDDRRRHQRLSRSVTGRIWPDQFSGPIGIARMSNGAASLGFVAFVRFAAIVSLSLSLTNLLPAPLLDDGHLLFYALEAALCRPLSRGQRVRRPAGGMLLPMAVRRRQRSASAIRVVSGSNTSCRIPCDQEKTTEFRGFWTLSGLQQSCAGIPCPGEQGIFLTPAERQLAHRDNGKQIGATV
jgi:Peptidase family M50